MKAKLPLIRAVVYVLLTVVIITAVHFTVHASLADKKEEVEAVKLVMEEKKAEFNSLSQQQQALLSRLDTLKGEISQIGRGKKITVNKGDLEAYLLMKSSENNVLIDHVENLGFKRKNGTWEVEYNIGVIGPYKNVVEFVDTVSKIGNNYFSEGLNILQAGPADLEEYKDEWINNEKYFDYEVANGESARDVYHVGGSIKFPVIIETNEKPRPFIRLQDIVYSDPTITRYDWQVDEVKLIIGDKKKDIEYGLGYPEVSFNKQEMRLNVDFELNESMIGSEVKGLKFSWRSLNKEHEVFLPLARPIVVTGEMFSEQPWRGQINEEIANYNLEMLNSIIYTDFNIVFLMDEVPDVYYDFVVEKLDEIKAQVQDNRISVPDSNTLVIYGEEERKYTIEDNHLVLNGEKLFELEDGQFVLNDQGLKIEFNVLGKMNYSLSIEGVSVGKPS